MNDVVAVLTRYEALERLWQLAAWGCAVYLLLLGVMVFLLPAAVSRFLEGFAASPRLNFVEAALRLTAGVALMGASPQSKLSEAFFWFGALLVATTIPMMFLYGLHRRYAAWAIPFAKRILPTFGILALGLGALLAWALI